MSTGRILCLDVATVTGWAEGVPGERPITGTFRAASPGATHGEIGLGFMKWLNDRLSAFPPKAIFYEAPAVPHNMQGRTNFNTIRVLIGLPMIVETVAAARGIWDVREASVNDIRKHFLGPGRRDRATAKRETMAKCRMIGWDTIDDNAADAAALFSFASGLILPKTAVSVTPLFADRSIGERRIADAIARDDAKRPRRSLADIPEIPD